MARMLSKDIEETNPRYQIQTRANHYLLPTEESWRVLATCSHRVKKRASEANNEKYLHFSSTFAKFCYWLVADGVSEH